MCCRRVVSFWFCVGFVVGGLNKVARSRLSRIDLGMIMAKLTLNQEQFAEVFNVEQSTVSRWLTGYTDVPGYVEAWLREAYPEVLYEHLGRTDDEE